MWRIPAICASVLLVLLARGPAARAAQGSPQPWLGVHVGVNSPKDVERLEKSIPALGKMGVNALVIEIDYSFQFKSHPELNRDGSGITAEQARGLADLCRTNGIRPIPQLNCLGHQSWAKHTGALLTAHPELDETPGKYPDNKGIYCRSWCPLNPDTDRIVFPLIDELIDAFKADAFHVGMDEVFILADPDCPRCKEHHPADLFAHEVNALHDHLVGERKVEMLMWADRLLDAKAMGYSKWEASTNGTAPAIDRIPHDVVLCDWHYERLPYPSLAYLTGKGFRVWPCGWHDVNAAESLIDASLDLKSPLIVGYLSTTWGKSPLDQLTEFPPTKLATEKLSIRPRENRIP